MKLKHIFDFIIAFSLLLFLLPLFLLVCMLLYASGMKTVFFTQTRPGKNERLFKIIKFKTMTDERDKNGNLLPDSIRLTPIGEIIRKLSLDELPQLINVLKGDMSLIGPRPLLPEYLPLYSETQKKRHEVKPGITGWAQVNGRNTLSWEKKFEYDVWYVKNWSFILDMKILWMTVLKVLKREGISAYNSATIEKFVGTT